MDAIAHICGKSKMCLAGEYGGQMPPVVGGGDGGGRPVEKGWGEWLRGMVGR